MVVIDHGRDDAGRRKQKWYSGYKTKKEAERALTRVLAAKDNGEHLPEAPTKSVPSGFSCSKSGYHIRKPLSRSAACGSPPTPSMPTSSRGR